jgi:phosphoglycolate phosphatase
LITDLDNTLYDWVSFFVPALYAMIDVAARTLAVDREQLLDELREVHQRYGSSEQPFALLETASAIKRFPGASRHEMLRALDEAFHAFNSVRKHTLQLYPGVESTLQALQDADCRIVAHTEAPVVNALFRLNALGLSRFITALYAPPSSGPGHPDPNRTQSFPSHRVHVLDHGERKPDPRILEFILSELHATPSETVYVGDSLTRDIAMARLVGATAAWAAYGRSFSSETWEKLVRVSHWTREDVEREAVLRREFANVKPDVTLSTFTDLLPIFCITAPLVPNGT